MGDERCLCSADPSGFVGPDHDFYPISGLKFGHQAGDVSLDSALADEELFGDLGVGLAPGDFGEDFLLTFGERVDGLGWGRWAFGVGKGLEKSGRDVGGDEGVSGGGGVDCLYEQILVGVFEEKAPGSGFESAIDVFVAVEGGDDDDRDRVFDFWSG